MNEISLKAMNCYLQANIVALLRFWVKIYHKDKEKYEECADGLEVVHTMLLTKTKKFKNTWKATYYCYDKVVKELQFMPRNDIERPGFEAAKIIFEKRLRGTK